MVSSDVRRHRDLSLPTSGHRDRTILLLAVSSCNCPFTAHAFMHSFANLALHSLSCRGNQARERDTAAGHLELAPASKELQLA